MAIDPKLVSIKEAKDLPTGEAKSTSEFIFFEDQVLKKSPMSNIYDQVTSGITGEATQTNAPITTGFARYIVSKPLTLPNSWGFAVTSAELATNDVYFNVTDGVVSKDSKIRMTPPVTGVVEEGNSNAVSGGEVYKALNVVEEKELVFISEETGFIRVNGTKSSNSLYKIIWYSYNDEKEVKVSTIINAEGINLISYFDASNNFISGEKLINSPTNIVIQDYELNIPVNTAKIAVNSIPTKNVLMTYLDIERIDFNDVLKNKKALLDFEFVANENQTRIDGKFINASGVYTNNSYYSITEYDVDDLANLYLTTNLIAGSNLDLIHYYNDSDLWLGKEYYEETAVITDFVKLQLNPPTGTTKFAINSGLGFQVSVEKKVFTNRIESKELLDKIENIENQLLTTSKMKVVVSETNFYIRTKLNETKDIIIKYIYDLYNNNISPQATYLGNSTDSDSDIMSNMYHETWDSTGPIWMPEYWYLFAQHGYLVPTLTANHTLTSDDIGSVWEDDFNREYTIGKIQGNKIWLLPKITQGSIVGKNTRSWKTSAQNNYNILNHISGAVNTTSIVPLTKSTDQLRPIETVKARSFLADGKEIGIGTFYCDELKAVNTMRCLNPVFATQFFPIVESTEDMCEITESFIFNGLSCSVNTTLKTLYPIDFTQYGANQAKNLTKIGNFESYLIIPKIKDRNIWGALQDFSKPVLSSNLSRSGLFIDKNSAHLIDVSDFPDRCIGFQKDSSDSYALGFVSGMSLTRGLTKKGVWDNHIGENKNVLDLSPSNQNKYYIRVLEGSQFENSLIPANYVAEINYYFSYFNPKDEEQVYHYFDGNKRVVYIHLQKDGVLNINAGLDFEGVDFEILEKTDEITLNTSTVQNGEIIVTKTNTNGGYIVLIEKI